jgi:Stage II sporulation protein E (SpoIIE)
VLCFTDGLIEEHDAGEEQFGEEQPVHWVNRVEHTEEGVRAVVRALSHALKQQRGGRTSDDATLFLIGWRGGAVDHLAILERAHRRTTMDMANCTLPVPLPPLFANALPVEPAPRSSLGRVHFSVRLSVRRHGENRHRRVRPEARISMRSSWLAVNS